MSGLRELGGPFNPGDGKSVDQAEIDEYKFPNVDTPSVDTAWYGAGTVAGTAVTAIALKNQLSDWPRNFAYGFTGGTSGGTFVANLVDQFGVAVTETVALGSIAGGGTVYGTAIGAKFLSGSIFPNTSTTGTYTIGNGTLANGSAQSNWFGLMCKIQSTTDVKNIRWSNNGTVTGLNKGTSIGTLINTTTHAFQGTSGVAITDTYTVTLKSTYNNNFKPSQALL